MKNISGSSEKGKFFYQKIHAKRGLSFLIWIVLLCSGKSVTAQGRILNRLTTLDGLPNISVLAVTQDARGFMWFGTSNGLGRYDGREVKNYKYETENPNSLSSSYIRSAYSDSKGILWIGTQDGLNKYDPTTDSFERIYHDDANENTLTDDVIRFIKEDRKGNLWIGTGDGLNRLKINDGKITMTRYFNEKVPSGKKNIVKNFYEDLSGILWVVVSGELIGIDPRESKPKYIKTSFREGKNILPAEEINNICGDKAHNIWISTAGKGLGRFDPQKKEWHFFQNKTHSGDSVLNGDYMILSRSGKLWIGTDKGLTRFDPQTGIIDPYFNQSSDKDDADPSTIMALFEDRENNIWIGTYSHGVNYISSHTNPFISLPYNFTNSHYNSVFGDFKGNVWYNSETKGVFQLNRKDNTLIPYVLTETDKDKFQSTYFDKSGTLWVGGISSKLTSYKTNAAGRIEIKQYSLPILDTARSKADHITSFLEDSQGRFWAGTIFSGLYLLDKKTETFTHYHENAKGILKLKCQRIVSLYEDTKNNIWIGTYLGVSLLKPGQTKMQWLSTEVKGPKYSWIGAVNCIMGDSKGQIWVGTFYNGLKRYDPKTDSLLPCKDLDILPDNNVANVQIDRSGYLWISIDMGLVRYHPDKKTILKYSFADGISGSEIVRNASYQTANGEMFFATNIGAFHFSPDRIPINNHLPPVEFTSLKLFNKPVVMGDKTGLLTSAILETKEIVFNHTQSIFTVDFAVLSFIQPGRNAYAYKLEGFENDWNYVRNPSATYTNLPPGHYTLLAKGANNDGLWSNQIARLKITILPPWWMTWYAYFAYLVAFSALAYFLLRFFWLRGVVKREKELQEAKSSFFTNISHEIRTHLTLISGPIEWLLDSGKENQQAQKQLSIAKRNADRLTNLVNELMDFQKIENGQTKLRVSQNDLIPFLTDILKAFEHISESKEIHTSFYTNSRSVMLWYDPDQLHKVMFNLLVNAYKFTPERGSVSLSVEELKGRVEIKITDDGKGIAPEHLNKLFTNYFQIEDFGKQNTGYGIGLALSRGIVELHKGKLSVTSNLASDKKNGWTIFTAVLPTGNEHFTSTQILAKSEPPVVNPVTDTSTVADFQIANIRTEKRYTILVVEDNAELRAFTCGALLANYNIIEAENGAQGWALITAHSPDLVISDIMMEGMDGLELCRIVKTDIRTSHIPVVLLSAKTTIPQQLEGLETGADLYMVKPFSIQVLNMNIKNIFLAREVLQEKYRQQISFEAIHNTSDNREEKFLNELVKLIEKFDPDREPEVAELSVLSGISPEWLSTKIRSLTGMSVSEYIKTIRLKKNLS